jgi:hypothetical protein
MLSICFLTVMTQVLGLFGIYGELYCQSFVYAVLMTVESWVTIWVVVQSPINWIQCLIFNILICIMAYIYAADLRKLRHDVQCSQTVRSPTVPTVSAQTVVTPPIYLTDIISPPPPYHPPPTYDHSEAMGKNYSGHVMQFDHAHFMMPVVNLPEYAPSSFPQISS